jgi:hypothetical protein
MFGVFIELLAQNYLNLERYQAIIHTVNRFALLREFFGERLISQVCGPRIPLSLL